VRRNATRCDSLRYSAFIGGKLIGKDAEAFPAGAPKAAVDGG
jgi:hypothetical protein